MKSVIQNQRHKCPACGENFDPQQNSKAAISPWILELSKIGKVHTTLMRECGTCRTKWFTASYPDSVMKAIYEEYRGEKYLKVRSRWEPTYSKQLNEALNDDPTWMAGRQQQVIDTLNFSGIDISQIKTVLDFGGGHGGVMPPAQNRYVYDTNEQIISKNNIKVIHSWDDAKNLNLDLVMCCGVLEHVNAPEQLVNLLCETNAKYFYIEVPSGTPKRRIGPLAIEPVLKILMSHHRIWSLIQKIERRFPKISRFMPLRCSEHLQFFTKEGLSRLLSKSGLHEMYLGSYGVNINLVDGKNLAFDSALTAIYTRR